MRCAGVPTDREYRMLEEHLTQLLLRVDSVGLPAGDHPGRTTRKTLVHEAQSALDSLEHKAKQNARALVPLPAQSHAIVPMTAQSHAMGSMSAQAHAMGSMAAQAQGAGGTFEGTDFH